MKSILSQNIRNYLAILYYYFSRKVYGRGYERYKQELILQTARSKNNQHMNEIRMNLNFLKQF